MLLFLFGAFRELRDFRGESFQAFHSAPQSEAHPKPLPVPDTPSPSRTPPDPAAETAEPLNP